MAAEAAASSAWPRGRGMGLGSGLGGGGATGAIGSLVVGWDKDSLSGGGLDRGFLSQYPGDLPGADHPAKPDLQQQAQRVRVPAGVLSGDGGHHLGRRGSGHGWAFFTAKASSRIRWTPIASPQWVRPPLARPCIASQMR